MPKECLNAANKDSDKKIGIKMLIKEIISTQSNGNASKEQNYINTVISTQSNGNAR